VTFHGDILRDIPLANFWTPTTNLSEISCACVAAAAISWLTPAGRPGPAGSAQRKRQAPIERGTGKHGSLSRGRAGVEWLISFQHG